MFRNLWTIFLALFFYQIAAAQTFLSVRDFTAGPTNHKMTISPSGQYLAYINSQTGKYCKGDYERRVKSKADCENSQIVRAPETNIVIYDIENDKNVKLVKVPLRNSIGWLEFGSDDKLLVSLATEFRFIVQGDTVFVTRNVRTMSISIVDKDPDKSDTVMLFENEKRLLRSNLTLASITHLLPDDPEHILMPAIRNKDTDLWKVNIVTGDAERIAKGKSSTFYWYTNRNGEPVFRYDCSYRCKKIKIYAQVEGKKKWEKIREFKINPDDDFDDFDFLPVAPTDNPTQFYVISREKTDPRRSVKVYDLATNDFVSVAFEHPEYDVNGAVSNPSDGSYLGASFYKDRLDYKFNDSQLQKYFKGIDRYFDNEANIEFLGWNADRTKIVVYVTAHNRAGTYYLYDTLSKSISEILDSRPKLQSGLNSDARVLEIPTRDGQSITAYHYFPKGQMTGKPLVVLPHGGPHVRDYFDYHPWVQYFVHQGFQVVQMNFRGSDGYGRSFEEAGHGEWGGLMQDDVTDTVKYFHSRGIASPEKTCIVGYSYGGYAALYGGATTPDLYKCVVSGGGVSNLLVTLKDDKKALNDENYDLILASIGDPEVNADHLKKTSPELLAAQFDDPVLILHGEDDERVKYHQAERMTEALKKAGKDVQLVPLKNAAHSDWRSDTSRVFLETVVQFVDRHIGQASERD